MTAARRVWFTQFLGVRLADVVFVDEFGATTDMARTHGRAPPGQRVVATVPRGHWSMVSTVAAMTVAGVTASAGVVAATDADLFVAFVREALVPTLRAGQVVVMDNLGPHKSPRARELVEGAGARVVLLPPYSPDFNPIEMAISKVKTYLRALARRSVDGLIAGIGEALGQVTAVDAAHYIEHCGYTLR